MTKYTVIAGNSSIVLGKKLAKKLRGTYVRSDLKVFPDGESKITINQNPPRGKIVVVQSTFPPVDSNLIQALALILKAKNFSGEVIAVIPYLGYARQDKEFLPGEVITMKLIGKLFKAAGASKIVVVDIHSMKALRYFKFPATNVSAIPELVKYFKKMKLNDPLVVSPDLGGISRAKEFSRLLGTKFLALRKVRDRKTGRVEIKSTKRKEVECRDLILVDDMISTGGSIIKATEFLKKQKCKKVFVACTHALLIEKAETKIKKAGVSRIISTNTISGKNSVVDVSHVIAKAI